jgi:hypothetical protein
VGSERQLWREAAGAAGLSAEELDLIARACELEGDLEEQVTVILATLSANLAGPFLRRFVDLLDPAALDAAEGSLEPAVRLAIRQTPMPETRAGEGGGG